MDLSQLLRPHAVKVLGSVTSKKRLFQELSEIAAQTLPVPPEAIVDALQDRESLGPTGVGHGVALPHARIPGITGMSGAFVRLERAMDFEAVDRQPVDLIFALFAPEEAGVQHLKALALVSRTMRDPAICAKLRANADPVTLHAVLTEGPRTRAA
ncbi:MAG: PTS sugar transporter subunit IIA [Rhodobacteraceae bacterium]|jgi:PTS system nitrogen regulatory IIA component|nr:PTS sugar transporter subunit IIA [Paracoccaceae bacterium]